MPKPTTAIRSIVTGLLLSIALPGCTRPADRAGTAPPPVGVRVEAPAPPADLIACADRPAGLPEDAELIAQIPARLRAGIIRLAAAFGTNAARLDRLINWNVAGSCPAEETPR